jgi:putative ABC transport system permease protein
MSSAGLLRHYALTLYRVLTRQRLYAALNVLGLAAGMAVFLVLWLDVRFETGFERWIPHSNQIYTIRTGTLRDHNPTRFTMGGLLDVLKGDYPQLVATRVWDQAGAVRQGSRVTAEKVELVDPSFFKVFDLPLAEGDAASALQAPDEVLISRSRARRYFGSADPIGRRLIVAAGTAPSVYRVVGVLEDPPADTDIPFDVVAPLTPQAIATDPLWRDWGSRDLVTYLRAKTPAEARALDLDLDRFVDRHAPRDVGRTNRPFIQLRLTPLLSLHLLDPKDAAVVAALGAVGLLTLLLAGVNYVNLATARAGLRAREVALRKVLGATAPSLLAQFMGEAVATTALAALIGLALAELALPLVNAAGGLSLRMGYFGPGGVVAPLLGAILLIGVGAGVYPALVLSRFQPAAVLAAARAPGGGRLGARVREGLVVIQFAMAIAFTIATAVILSQTSYLRRADLGFRREGLIVVNSLDDTQVTASQRASLLAAWRATPWVTSVAMADIAPGNDDNTSAAGVKRAGATTGPETVNLVETSPDFFPTYGVRLLAGRALDLRHGGDEAPQIGASMHSPVPPAPAASPPNVVINATAARVLGFASPGAAVGARLQVGIRHPTFLVVAGVVEDIRFRTPHSPSPPTIYALTSQDFAGVAGVRYAGVAPQAILAALGARWRETALDTPFRAATVEDNLEPYYRPDDQHGRLFTAGALLAVGIGCLGLYGLASFSTARRVREIGIRKTLGASTGDVLRLLVGQFLRPVLLANLVAWPLAWLAMRNWLAGFDQRIALGPGYFLGATVLTLLIAVATVAGQAFAVARAEPAKALRHE